MGHRANFIVIQNRVANAYYDQRAALGCLDAFASRPDDAVGMLNQFEPTTELLDWAFAEGGYLIDFDDRTAIAFGSPVDESDFDFNESDDESLETTTVEEAQDFNALKFLQRIAPAWKGWKLIFDDAGVDAFNRNLKSKEFEGIECQPISHPSNTKDRFEFQA